MVSNVHRLAISLALLVAATVSVLAGDTAPDQPLPANNLAGLRGAAQLLGQELESAEQYIVLKGGLGPVERAFYKMTDAALKQLRKLNKQLAGTPTRQQLYQNFTPLQERVNWLLDNVQDTFALDTPMRHIANRIAAGLVEVRYNLLLGDTNEGRSRELLQSQIRALLMAAQNLNATGQYVLGSETNQAALVVNMKALVQATQQLQLKYAGGAMGEELRQAFALVTAAWERVTAGIGMTSSEEIVGFYSNMMKMSTAYQRVQRLMGVGGMPPSFQIPD